MNLDKKEIANFVFRDDEAYWTLSHRIFHHDTDDRSRLTGSWLLAKLESLFCVLFEKNIIPEKPLHIDAGQKSVMAWVRKNEYDFASPEEQERYQRMHDHPEDFVFDVSVTVVPGITRHGYVIEKDKYTNELSALLKKPVTEETANELIYKTFFRVSFRKTPDQLRHERHTEPSVP